jgi:hypothetical protein
VVWRPPLASVGLLVIFLGLLVVVEWASRRMASQRLFPSTTPETESVQQQMTRTTTENGLDKLEGVFWAKFPENATTTTVHIPFCPAFASVPNIQVFPVDETDANLRVVSPKVFGVRIDVKRSNLEAHRLCFAIIAEDMHKPDDPITR